MLKISLTYIVGSGYSPFLIFISSMLKEAPQEIEIIYSSSKKLKVLLSAKA
ncbi:MAG: hypothetical protein QXT34_00005 [Candidatus Aenigmatarchaeota archaeon]